MSKRKAIDGVSSNPEHAIKAVVPYTDWETLKKAFLLNETHTMVGTWLNEVVGWPEGKIRSGHTRRMVRGWGKLRAKTQAKITEVAIEEALELERKNVPTLRQAKASLIKNVMGDIKRWDRLNMMDKKLCYEILKVELREPTNVKDLSPVGARDPVEALLEEFGLMKDGEIIDDEPESDQRHVSGGDSQTTPTANIETSAEVPQP